MVVKLTLNNGYSPDPLRFTIRLASSGGMRLPLVPGVELNPAPLCLLTGSVGVGGVDASITRVRR